MTEAELLALRIELAMVRDRLAAEAEAGRRWRERAEDAERALAKMALSVRTLIDDAGQSKGDAA